MKLPDGMQDVLDDVIAERVVVPARLEPGRDPEFPGQLTVIFDRIEPASFGWRM